MGTSKPVWRQVFDTVERAVGGPLEDAVNSPRYAQIMATGIRTRRVITGTAGRLVGGAVGTALRALNIPTRDDVQRINRNLSVLAGELRAMSAQRVDPTGAGPGPDGSAAPPRGRSQRRTTAADPARRRAASGDPADG